MRLIVGITGATGAPFGVRLLELLRDLPDVETHLVMSRWARTTIELETPYTAREVAALADVHHGSGDQAASISSGSFRTDGMIIAPCSMKTLAGIRTGYADGLVGRAADVVLKERRKLVLVPRETPLSEIHLETCWPSPAWERSWCRRCRPSTTTRSASATSSTTSRCACSTSSASRPRSTPRAGRAYPTATGGPGRPSGRPGMRREPSLLRIPRPSGPEHLISTSWMR
jgi:flavin prenyltransferase